MSDLYLKPGFIVYIDDPLFKYYRILRREALDYETGEEDVAIFSAIASGAESGFKNIAVLEPDKDPFHLFQVLMGFIHSGDIKYYIKNPSGQNRLGVDDDKEIGFLNADKSPYYDPNPDYEMYLIADWYPAINCKNNSPVTITPKIYFKGMKYDVEELDAATAEAVKAGKIPYRKIVFGGLKVA